MPQLTIQEAFNLAMRHHQAGQLQQAENLYRQILARQPDHADALHFLGVIAHQAGRNDIAVDLIRRAIVRKPTPEAHNNLGNALKGGGQLDEAIAAFRQAIALRHNYPEAYSNLGNVLKDKGQLDEAIAAHRQAIALEPNSAESYGNLGNALADKGQLDEAIAAYRQFIALRPDSAEALSNLGNALAEKGQLDEAITLYLQAIALRPSYAEAHSNLANALSARGELDKAIAAYRQAIALTSGFSEPHLGLGNALKDKGQFDEATAAYQNAIAACQRAIVVRPNYAEAHLNLGIALKAIGQLDDAIAAFQRAIVVRPSYVQALLHLGGVLKDTGQLDEAVAAYRQAIAARPDHIDAHSHLLYTLHCHPAYDARAIALEHREWNQRHAETLNAHIKPHPNDRDPDRRLRIGYVSPDFREHPVGRFLLPLLENHDHRAFEVFAYANARVADAMTQRLRSHVDGWRGIVGLSDAQTADLIRADRIDILVDLAGHTANNRLLVFARKPAPVQVTYLGYPNSTGLTTIDYRVTDAHADPPGLGDTLHSELLFRLPQTNWIYQPSENGPAPDHQMVGGPITFGCFNNFAKVTEPMLVLWGRILKAVPESRLLLKAQAMASPSTQQRVRELLIKEGIDAARVELRGYEPEHGGHLALYNQMDIALDPFPYHGTTTTCDALWMGVPVIALAGRTHVSRVAVSLLSNVGLPELVANSPDEYVEIAVGLAGDRARLTELRSTLRRRMEASPLMDAPEFARDMEAAYRRMWRTWCQVGGDAPNSRH